jgi:hypothetical protein
MLPFFAKKQVMIVKKYKVIALNTGGLRNSLFKSGDIVTEADFKPGEAELKVKGGFLEPIQSNFTAAEKIEMIEKAKTVVEVDELMEDDSRKTVVAAAEIRKEEIEADQIEAAEKLVLQSITDATDISVIKTFLSDQNSENVIEAAERKLDGIYINSILESETVEDLAVYLEGDYSEDVKTAAEIKSDELK